RQSRRHLAWMTYRDFQSENEFLFEYDWKDEEKLKIYMGKNHAHLQKWKVCICECIRARKGTQESALECFQANEQFAQDAQSLIVLA
ncbi:hypothetical protein, partial [Nostoc sp.]